MIPPPDELPPNDAALPLPARKPRKRSAIRHMMRGGGIGGAIAIVLLIFYAVLVFMRATSSSVSVWSEVHPAGVVTEFLFSFVCFGPLFLAFCTFLGMVVGFLRSRF